MWTALADEGKGGGHCDTAVAGHEHKDSSILILNFHCSTLANAYSSIAGGRTLLGLAVLAMPLLPFEADCLKRRHSHQSVPQQQWQPLAVSSKPSV